MDFGAVTHPGYVRSSNEDGYFVSQEDAVFAVADGMGGHEHGEIASGLALEVIAERAPSLARSTPGELANDLYDAMQDANTRILNQADVQDARSRMGTTLVLATIYGDRLYFAHIGDSRLYLLRGDVFTQLTRDHSLVQSMVEEGKISSEEAAIHPLRHQITRVVGGEHRVSPEIASQALEPGDLILLCSDGLSGAVDAETMRAILHAHANAQERAEALVHAALSAGGPDNITVVVVSYQCPRPIPQADPGYHLHHTHHLPSWKSLLASLAGVIMLLLAVAIWQYYTPRYSVAINDRGVFGLYRTWPLLPMLDRQPVPADTDLLAISITEAQPYLVQPAYQPKSGDMHIGISVKNAEAGRAVLDTIVQMTASGLIQEARKSLNARANRDSIQQLLERAEALHADQKDLRELTNRMKLLEPGSIQRDIER